MPLIFKKGNLFDSKCDIFVNACNKVGVMGTGIALEFKKRYPKTYKEYVQKCKSNDTLYSWDLFEEEDKIIMCFYTKEHWRDKSELKTIEYGLETLQDNLLENPSLTEQYSYAFPALGCGHGGLAWSDVKALFIKYLSNVPNTIEVYEPY